MIHLVIGGARSGKSRFAEQLASATKNEVVYVATATIGDEEMRERIKHHQQTRSQDWLLIEEPFHLSQVIRRQKPGATLIIECMTLWLSNWLCSDDKADWLIEKQWFIDALSESQLDFIIVSNEVGSGIVPMGELSRDFVDQAGWLNQSVAEIADIVTLVTAGCALVLKSQQNKLGTENRTASGDDS